MWVEIGHPIAEQRGFPTQGTVGAFMLGKLFISLPFMVVPL